MVAIVLAVVAIGLFAAWNFWWSTATARLGRYLDVSDLSSEESIEADLLRKFRVGTPIAVVVAFLDRNGLNRATGTSRYYPSNENGDELPDTRQATSIACVFDFTTASIQFVKEHYYVWFLFDEKQRLKSVKVNYMLTGL